MLRLHARRGAFTIRALQHELRSGLIETLPDASDREDLDATCGALAQQIAARWPTTWVDGGSFGRYLARRLDPGVDLAAALAEIWVADLYLACAVAGGVPAALAAFDQLIKSELPPALRTIDPSDDAIDETLQLLRERLLVAQGRLESYSGHGPLAAWLRVSALRIALGRRRKLQPEATPDDELTAILDLAPNAEVRVIAQQVGADLRAALRTAIAEQPARIRAVLGMYYADDRGVEDIGRVYQVHASTVSRWLAKARADILARTREELLGRLRTSPSQVDSLLGHAASLEISLGSLLGSRG